MTNREKIIEELKTKDESVAAYFMCPYIPGEKGAGCKDQETAVFGTECAPCIQKWLDKEGKE